MRGVAALARHSVKKPTILEKHGQILCPKETSLRMHRWMTFECHLTLLKIEQPTVRPGPNRASLKARVWTLRRQDVPLKVPSAFKILQNAHLRTVIRSHDQLSRCRLRDR